MSGTNEQTRSGSANGNGEGIIGIPDELRCKRSDGKQWRCTAMSMPDKLVCEKHYVQAKKRAANSASRASQRKVQRRSSPLGETDTYSVDDQLGVPSSNGHASGSKYDGGGGVREKRHDKSVMNRYTSETPMMRSFASRVAVDLNDELAGDGGMFEERYISYRTPSSAAMMDRLHERSHQSMSPVVQQSLVVNPSLGKVETLESVNAGVGFFSKMVASD